MQRMLDNACWRACQRAMNSTTVFTLKDVPAELANAFRAARHLNGKRYREVHRQITNQTGAEVRPCHR